jgi:hypothetical protein
MVLKFSKARLSVLKFKISTMGCAPLRFLKYNCKKKKILKSMLGSWMLLRSVNIMVNFFEDNGCLLVMIFIFLFLFLNQSSLLSSYTC